MTSTPRWLRGTSTATVESQVLRQPLGNGLDHRFDFLLGRIFPADQFDPFRVIGRIGLRVIRGGGLDVRDGQRIPHSWFGMLTVDPLDQLVRQRNDAWLAAA